MHDFSYAARSLRKSPGFTAAAVLTLALGLGASVSVFCLLNAVLLRDLPVSSPEELVEVSIVTRTGREAGLSLPIFREFSAAQDVFSDLIGWTGNLLATIEVNGELTQGGVWGVTGNFYRELGIRPFAGRLLTADDVNLLRFESAPVAVIGYTFWQRTAGSDPSIIGRSIRVEGTSFTVVGIAPRGFTGFNLTHEPDVTVPVTAQAAISNSSYDFASTPGLLWLRVVGRLMPGRSIQQARVRLAALWSEVKATTVPATYEGARREGFLSLALDLKSAAKGVDRVLRPRLAQPLYVVMALALLILLLACVSLAGLMLSRSIARSREVGICMALGASRWQIARQVLAEALLLSAIAVGCSLIFAAWTSRVMFAYIVRGFNVPSTLDVGPDPRVLAVTGLLALVVGLLFSAVPAWRASHRDPALLLQEGPNVTAATGRTGAVLVGTQIALSIVLLINAGLLVRTLELLAHVDPGLQTDGVLILEPRSRPGAHEGLDYESYHRQLIEELRSVRGVRAASISQGTPLMGAD